MKEKITVGLTGGIASGKSAAAEMFRGLGAYIIDTDIISRQVSDSSEAQTKLREAFTMAYESGKLDRARLREIVFESEEKRKILNGIMHPLILRETLRLANASAAKVNIVVAPLLIEAGFDKHVDCIITVSCSESTRIQRLVKRDAIEKELAQSMINSQLTDKAREEKSDYVIYNDGNLAELRAQVIRVYCEISDSLGR